ncbi:hypothetical protein HYH03_014135 [Edaphochlamys debaryana]|uniref:Uncharacterized protein n=1 Tax=Edaphochlamys debaryana TaxID=47281 RepID=A0A835XUV2_9CHLO|nr:hypothetical protein HYH03_014135 [Edaphochlamys debaryana]|eukprot:KAG2487295.1 hypothetical protein HYH03_014135 [Edaphochlamys debaryana]
MHQTLQPAFAGFYTGLKRERSSSVEDACDYQDASAVEAAEMLFNLASGTAGKRNRMASDGFNSGPNGVDSGLDEEEEAPQPPCSSSSMSGASGGAIQNAPRRASPAGPDSAASPSPSPKAAAPVATTTRSYVWRGPKRLGSGMLCPGQMVLSSDPDEEDESPSAAPAGPSAAGLVVLPAAIAPAGSGDRADRDKEWAALTTWLRMNLHHPRTTKREVLFLGQHVEGRGWNFFLNPALGWNDVSPETKMRLRTLPQETELAFSRKYPNKPPRDWVKKTQKYRPPGCSVTYAVPLADLVYSLTSIYYKFEGRPGRGESGGASRAGSGEL